jgi:hypothetical protein
MTVDWTCLQNLHFVLDSSIEIYVVRSNTGGDAELKILSALEDICGEIARVEWGGNQDFSLIDGRESVRLW